MREAGHSKGCVRCLPSETNPFSVSFSSTQFCLFQYLDKSSPIIRLGVAGHALSSSTDKCLGKAVIGPQGPDAVGDGFHGLGIREYRSIPNLLANPANIGGHDRTAHGPGFYHGNISGSEESRHDEGRGLCIKDRNIRVAHVPEVADTSFDSQAGCRCHHLPEIAFSNRTTVRPAEHNGNVQTSGFLEKTQGPNY